MFVIVNFSSGVSSTVYVDLSLRALTLMTESWQSTGTAPGAASVPGSDADEGSTVGADDDSAVGSVDGPADGLDVGAGLDCSVEPREVNTHQIPKINVPKARSSVSRLIQ